MSANPKHEFPIMTIEEYLEFERNSDIKHEYINGIVRPVYLESDDYIPSFSHVNHNRLTAMLTHLTIGHLQNDCEAFAMNQRIKIENPDTYFYPDISVVCGQPHFTDDNPQALLNPILIIEVLSPSTEKFDRDDKFRMYRSLESLREYVLVSQDTPQIKSFYLNDTHIWEFTDAVGLDSSILLQSIDCTLSLADVYQRVIFEE